MKESEKEVKEVGKDGARLATPSAENVVASGQAVPQKPSGSLLAGSISIGSIKPVKSEAPKLKTEVKPLTQEDLERYWKEAGEELGLQELLGYATVKMGERPGLIEIDAKSVSFHDEFKPHRIEVMEALRKRAGMPMLNCKVNPMFIEKDDVLYSPSDKYYAMVKQNPRLIALRKLFPIIDY